MKMQQLSLDSTFEMMEADIILCTIGKLIPAAVTSSLGFSLSEIKAVRPVEESDYIETQKALNSHEKRHLQLIETLDESWIFETTGGTSVVRDKMIEGIQHVYDLIKQLGYIIEMI